MLRDVEIQLQKAQKQLVASAACSKEGHTDGDSRLKEACCEYKGHEAVFLQTNASLDADKEELNGTHASSSEEKEEWMAKFNNGNECSKSEFEELQDSLADTPREEGIASSALPLSVVDEDEASP